MKASEGRPGRIFILRLEHGDDIPGCIERFAAQEGISVAQVILIGGVDRGEVVTGPRRTEEMPPDPILLPVDGAHELAGVGILAPDKDGRPVLHVHAALGRAGKTTCGCLRPGVSTWLVGEVVICEILGVKASRLEERDTGFELLSVR